jgi:RecJ-like exonuclease
MKTLILTHADTDGLCSGALALAVYGSARVLFSNPISLPGDLKHAGEYDRVIVCDIAIDMGLAADVKKALDSLSNGKEIIYIDHHPLPPGFKAPWLVHNTNACGSLLTFDYFRQALDIDLSRVAMYGAIGDYRDNTPLAAEFVRRWDKRSLYYQAGTLSQGIEMTRRNYDYKRFVLERLSKNALPSEIDDLHQKAITASHLEEGLRERVERSVERLRNVAYVINPDGFISKAAIYARIYGERPVGICAEYRNEKHAFDLSARTIARIDLNVLLNEAATRCGGHGGGHPMAGGGRVPARNLKKFLGYLDELLERELAGKDKKILA